MQRYRDRNEGPLLRALLQSVYILIQETIGKQARVVTKAESE